MNTKSLTLSLFLLLSTGLLQFSLADGLSSERLELPHLGISFQKPEGWHQANRQLFEQNLKKLDEEKEDIDALIKDARGSLLVAGYMKYDPNTYPDVIPTIQVMIRLNPAGDGEEFKEFIGFGANQLKNYLNKYTITENPNWKRIGNRNLIRFEAQYELTIGQGVIRNIQTINYVIPVGGNLVQISFSGKDPIESEELFESFIKSLE